MTEKTGKF